MVTAAAQKVPQQLKDQLSQGGLLVAPIGATYGCEMLTFKKITPKNFQTSNHGFFSFVPLV
jgi:Protein-L-isoaspartate carboxylmethyltransferase